MSNEQILPRILIIDDLFGRSHHDRRNEERSSLCGQYLLDDVTNDESDKEAQQIIKHPIARAVFHRGQRPLCSKVGDVVENDLDGTMNIVRQGWFSKTVGTNPKMPSWAMVLLDLCFYTGKVTEESNRRTLGMPEVSDGDEKDYFGLKILERIRLEMPDIPVILLSSKPRSKEVAERFTELGALGFLPREDSQSRELLKQHLWEYGIIPDTSGIIVGTSKPILFALRAARRYAAHRKHVLIRGERGTGKEFIADYIHQTSPQRSHPLVTVNSANFDVSLYGSELFGHEKGAFTGAGDKKLGLINKADGSDLFLDEIGDMPTEVQAGMLRFLQEREVRPVGGTKPIKLDVRVISATNMDIEAAALGGGGFREDLLDRLREGGTIFLPPLRERKDDIPLLVEKFVRAAEAEIPGTFHREIKETAIHKLLNYDWPGNIRELKSCIFNAVGSFRHVEYLDPIHIQLPENRQTSSFPKATETPATSQDNSPFNVANLDGLIKLIDDFDFARLSPSDLANRLPHLRGAYARLLAQYLKFALEATCKRTPKNPNGDAQIHPAIKLIEGDQSLSASTAADFVIRILKTSLNDIEEQLADPLLSQAYDKARKLRRQKPSS